MQKLPLLLSLAGCHESELLPKEVERVTPSSPDIVLVIVDTLRADALGIHSEEARQLGVTPNLDAFASDNIIFSNAVSTGTWTVPSTAGIMLGKYPWEHRVGPVDPAYSDSSYTYVAMPDDGSALAHQLREQGYRTVGVVNNTYLNPKFGWDSGFDAYHYEGSRAGEHRTAKASFDLAIEELQQSDTPVFAWVHLMDPHRNYVAQEPSCVGKFTGDREYSARDFKGEELKAIVENPQEGSPAMEKARAKYLETACSVDQAYAQFLQQLEEITGGNRILVITADHGELFGEHERFEHGGQPVEELLRVPLIVSMPESVSRNTAMPVNSSAIYDFLVHRSGPIASAINGFEQKDFVYFREKNFVGAFDGNTWSHFTVETGPTPNNAVSSQLYEFGAYDDLKPSFFDRVVTFTPADNFDAQQCASCGDGQVLDELKSLGYLE